MKIEVAMDWWAENGCEPNVDSQGKQTRTCKAVAWEKRKLN